jgi:hypothetical protein
LNITLFGLLAVVGFLSSGFILWLGAKEENLPEDEVFDVYLVSGLWAFAAARIAAVVLEFDRFGMTPLRWLSFFSLPGLNAVAALTIGVLMIAVGIVRHRWDSWLGLDVFAPAILLWQAALITLTDWRIAIFWLLWFAVLVAVGRKYRFWEWYKGRRDQSRPGLVFSGWLIGNGVAFMVFSIPIGSLAIIAGLILGYRRSGRIVKNDIADIGEKLTSVSEVIARPIYWPWRSRFKRRLPRRPD